MVVKMSITFLLTINCDFLRRSLLITASLNVLRTSIEGLREKRQSTLRPLNLSYVSDQIDRKLTQIIYEKARLLIKIQNFMTLSDHKKGLVYVSN